MLFSDVLYCADCKDKMYAQRSRLKNFVNSYICKNSRKADSCSSHYINENKLAESVKKDINNLISSNKEIIINYIKTKNRIKQKRHKLKMKKISNMRMNAYQRLIKL